MIATLIFAAGIAAARVAAIGIAAVWIAAAGIGIAATLIIAPAADICVRLAAGIVGSIADAEGDGVLGEDSAVLATLL